MQILKTKPYSSPLSTLDVPSSPRPPWWQSVPGQVALSAGAFLLVLFARRPETFLNPPALGGGRVYLLRAGG